MRCRHLLPLALALAALAAPAAAEDWPNRPMTMIVPFAAGGPMDTLARILQPALGETLGQQIVIENVGGAGGMIAAARAARAPSDGYTILIHQVALAAGMTLYPNLGVDAEKDFVAIGLINTSASTLAARLSLPPNTIGELVHWMNEPGRNTKIAHAGIGSFGNLAGVLLAQEIGGAVTHIPYRGAGPALNDLLGEQVDISSISAVVAAPLVRAGKLKAYAIIGRSRFVGLPDLPTMGEVGYKKLDLDFWHMLLAPAGTSQIALDRLNRALIAALSDAKVRKTFDEGGMDLFAPDQQTPQAAAALLRSEIKLWGAVIRANNISGQ